MIIPRADWGARPALGRVGLDDPTYATIHWNGPPRDYSDTSESEAAQMRAIQNFHMDNRGWSDIAYSFCVFQSGRVYEARGWNIRTAGQGTEEGNDTSHAHYWANRGTEPPTAAAVHTMGLLVQQTPTRLDEITVRPHSWWKQTDCPGDDWRELIEQEWWKHMLTAETQQWLQDLHDHLTQLGWTDGENSAKRLEYANRLRNGLAERTGISGDEGQLIADRLALLADVAAGQNGVTREEYDTHTHGTP